MLSQYVLWILHMTYGNMSYWQLNNKQLKCHMGKTTLPIAGPFRLYSYYDTENKQTNYMTGDRKSQGWSCLNKLMIFKKKWHALIRKLLPTFFSITMRLFFHVISLLFIVITIIKIYFNCEFSQPLILQCFLHRRCKSVFNYTAK